MPLPQKGSLTRQDLVYKPFCESGKSVKLFATANVYLLPILERLFKATFVDSKSLTGTSAMASC